MKSVVERLKKREQHYPNLFKTWLFSWLILASNIGESLGNLWTSLLSMFTVSLGICSSWLPRTNCLELSFMINTIVSVSSSIYFFLKHSHIFKFTRYNIMLANFNVRIKCSSIFIINRMSGMSRKIIFLTLSSVVYCDINFGRPLLRSKNNKVNGILCFK